LFKTRLNTQGVHKFFHENLILQKKIFLSYKFIAIYDIFQLEIKEGRFELINFIQNTVEYTGCSKIFFTDI